MEDGAKFRDVKSVRCENWEGGWNLVVVGLIRADWTCRFRSNKWV